jgi:transposase
MDKPSPLHIVRTIRPKFAYKDRVSGIVIGKFPSLPVDKGNAGPGLLAVCNCKLP